jgi:ubiquinone/menaquinone biosynthesis C-methylase UbiE/DNA-binding transcriptional ArsR family regulator
MALHATPRRLKEHGQTGGEMRAKAAEVVEMLRAAGEPTRLRVLALLAREELAVTELVQILGHSQPRVSRHLKLLAEASLVERFPDGAWVFYRLHDAEPQRSLVHAVLDRLPEDEGELRDDLERLDAVRQARMDEASAYFARNAAHWDEIRSLYVSEAAVEAAILDAAGEGPYPRLIDLGTGAGRMLTLLGPRAEHAIGLDLSQQMLNIARAEVGRTGLSRVELRHGDIYATGLPARSAERVVIHRVLHYLADPGGAIAEAARLLGPGGRLLIVDFAPHGLEYLRQAHQHRRLGFSDEEIERWVEGSGLAFQPPQALSPEGEEGLTVKIWTAERTSA